MELPPIVHTIRNNYSPEALKELKEIFKESSNLVSDRPLLSGITIDQAHSRDLDDGVWAYWDGEHSHHILEVSIADVTEFVKKGSALDWEALSRTTSIYFESYVLHMFPKEISTDLASLNHQTNRLTLSCRMRFSESYDLVSVEVFESIFYNKFRFDYNSFDEAFTDSSHDMYSDLNYMLEFAKNLYPKRAHLKFSDDDRKICIGGKCKDNQDFIPNPSFIIQEFMIFTNMAVTKWMLDNKITATFRNHMPEYKNKEFNGNMQRAFYNQEMIHHYALGLDFYCHFTSPIRRYADIVVHRQIKSKLNNKKADAYKYNEVKLLSLYINQQIYNLRQLQNQKEIDNERKRHDRILNKIVSGKYTDDMSRISEDLYEEVIKYLFEHNSKIPDYLRSEIFFRLDGGLINGDLLNMLFFCNDYDIATKAFYKIHTKNLHKQFFNFLDGFLDFEVDYQKCGYGSSIMHTLNVLKNGQVIANVFKIHHANKNFKKELFLALFLRLRLWRDAYYFKKEKLSLTNCSA